MVRPLRIHHKLVHTIARLEFGAFITKRIALAARTGFNTTGGAMSGSLLAFATMAGIRFRSRLRAQPDWTGSTIQAAVSIKHELHMC
jgi:hypothetical protein